MKKTLTTLSVLAASLLVTQVYAQSKKELKAEMEQLKLQNQLMMQMLQNNQQGNAQQGDYRQGNDSYPHSRSGQDADESGYAEIETSPIEELSYEFGTNEIRAYGSAESAKEQLSRASAEGNAIAALQRKIETYVRYGLDQYSDETGVNGNYSIDEKTREQVVIAAKGVVEGAVVLRSRKLFNKKTKRYKYEVCVKYDRAGVLSAIVEQDARIRANEKQFEQDMLSAWDELDARNHRLSPDELRAQRANEMEQENKDRQAQRDAAAAQLKHEQDMQAAQQQNEYNLKYQQNEQRQKTESQKQ